MIKRLCLFVLLGAGVVGTRAATPFDTSPLGPAVATAAAGPARADAATGNQLAIISGGYDALLLRVHLIRQARVSIEVQTFIWTNDECGRLLICELIEAARRGVRVRIIADHLVSAQDPAMTAFLATVHPNLEVKHYRPAMARMRPTLLHKALAAVRSFHALNQRMHNKLMVFDGAILLTGGRNIENTYFDHSTEMNFRDRDVLAVGPVVRAATASFDEFWGYRHAVASADLTDVGAIIARGTFPRYATRADYDFGGFFGTLTREADDAAVIQARFADRLKPVAHVVFISDEPGKSAGYFSHTARITRELRRTLERAEKQVLMQTPYLVLSNPAQKLLREMQDKNPGLRVRISSNSFASTDNLLAYSANYRLRNNYVEDLHLEVHEFKPHPAALPALFPQHVLMAERAAPRIAAGRQKRPPFLCLHAKSLVVDDRLAFIGSYNLDPRSERLNTEVGLLVEDAGFARELRDEIERDMRPENSWVIARRNIPLRLDAVNGLIDGILSLGPVDVWPIQNTSSFELRPGAAEVPPGDPAFYRNYREVGSFPGTEGLLSTKEILTRIYKAVGTPLTPVL
ncbi:MAG: phospholipase D family protein [Lacunisphaera sp.]|nr:phospholipase D family protein [Lacunisphaera sp.]